jgi:hypothetical protein
MLARLTNSSRIRAGRLFALVYLFSVLAPAFALALGDPAPCFQTEIDAVGITRSDVDFSVIHHMHRPGSQDRGMQADSDHGSHHHHGKTSTGPCCAMLCLSAIPADLPVIAKPSLPISFLASAGFRPLAGQAPPLHYRPPIA